LVERPPLPEALDRDSGRDRVGAERRPADRDHVQVADPLVHQLADQRRALGREGRLLAVEEVGGALAGAQDEVTALERARLEHLDQPIALGGVGHVMPPPDRPAS
jgi:hypothetical protein